jgi:RNA polymerase sigma-70 factor (ECF subfamily)
MHLAPTPATPPLDAERARIQAGDRAAIERVYRAEVDALYAFIYPRVGSRKDVAEDVVQTVFMQAFHQIERFDPQRASFQVWLRLLSRNIIRSHRRADETSTRLRKTLRRVQRHLHRQQALPEKLLAQAETRDLVQMALATLPVTQANLLRARYLEQRAPAKLAAQMGIEPAALRSRMTRARKAFQRAFVRLQEALDD